MDQVRYTWKDGELLFVHVEGTRNVPYHFGDPPQEISVNVEDFFIATVPVTQSFWTRVNDAEDNPALNHGGDLPVENVSWDMLTSPSGFLDKLNQSRVALAVRQQVTTQYTFRLPSETEWEYAARGGPHWRDGFRYSGSDDVDAVAWYDRRHGDHTQPVARKAPNQLGIYDMSGNVWEWCQDTFSRDVSAIPRDGAPYMGPGNERVLRGGCFHNWAMHCTVSKRYEIARDCHDGCIGFRLVLANHVGGKRGA